MRRPLPGFVLRCCSALAMLGAVGCSDADEKSAPGESVVDAALRSAVDGTIVPATEDFADGTASLETSVTAFCDAPTEAGLTASQDEWLALARTWNRAGIYFLGPLEEDIITPTMIYIESMRQRGTDYTDTVRDTIDSAMNSSDPLDDAYFDRLAFNRVGMLALEVLLFENSSTEPPSTDVAAVTQGYVDAPRKCSVLVGMARLLRRQADEVERGWTVEFAGTGRPFRDIVLGDELPNGAVPVNAVLLAAIQHIEYLRVRKLDGILDVAVASSARPDATPFYDNLGSGLDGLEALMEPPGSDSGFFAAMTARGFENEVTIVRNSFAAAHTAVDAGDRSAASAAYLDLETSFRKDVTLGLGVDLGLTFSDGD